MLPWEVYLASTLTIVATALLLCCVKCKRSQESPVDERPHTLHMPSIPEEPPPPVYPTVIMPTWEKGDDVTII